MWQATISGLRAHKLRLVLTAMSIVLGVAFVTGTFILGDTIGNTFNQLFSTVYSNVSVQVRQPTPVKTDRGDKSYAPLAQGLVGQVAAVPGVRAAEGGIMGFAQLVDKRGKAISPQAPTFGASWHTVQALSAFTVKQGRGPSGPGEVAIDGGTAAKYSFHLGDQVKILFSGPPQQFTIVGITRFGRADNLAGATMASFDMATAQQVLDRPGQYDTIDVLAQPGVSQSQLQHAVAQALPGQYQAVTGRQLAQESAKQVKQNVGILTQVLLIFALVSLFVGSFIILNTFSILVAQRTREFALFRSLGASRRQVLVATLAEAGVVGVIASALGLAGGFGVAAGLQALFKAVGFTLPSYGLVFRPMTAVWALAVGIGVSLFASVNPARRASRVAPVAAIGDPVGLGDGASSMRRRSAAGTALGLVGLGFMSAGLFGGTHSKGLLTGVGVALTFIGVATLAPLVARPVASAVGWILPWTSRGVVRRRDRSATSGVLALENAKRNPRRTAATASALMIGLALVTTFSIFGQSLKTTLATNIDNNYRADYQLGASGFRGISPTVESRAAAVPGVVAVSGERTTPASYQGHGIQLTGVDPRAVSQVLHLDMTAGGLDALGRGQLLVEGKTARGRGLHVGSAVTLDFVKTGRQTLRVGGLYKANQSAGSYLVSEAVADANTTEPFDAAVLVKTAPGVNQATVRTALEDAVADLPNVKVSDIATVKADQQKQVDQILLLIYVLLALAVIIAVLGIVNTLVLSTLERTRELGLLRAVGMVRAQMRSMIRGESVIIAVFGALLGVAVGIGFGVALVKAMASSGLSSLGIPFQQLAVFVAASALIGALAAIWPARRASRLDVLDALAHE
jgi:putative ABC transport system permease protein